MFRRTEIVLGAESVEKLKKARVLVVGLGGVGGYIVEALARAGVGTLGLCDFDKVDVSNKNRQILALDSTVGQLKTDVCEKRVKDINPDCAVVKYQGDIKKLLDGTIDIQAWDYIADAIDDVPGKIMLIKLAKEGGVRIISSMGTGNKLDPSQFKIADISKTNTCPLAKKVRLELRKEGIDKGVKVLFSTELPVSEASSSGPVGSVSFVPSVAGLMIGGEIIKEIAQKA